MFFVISGYLITGLLIEEQKEQGKIRYGSFLMRRMRRLYPALLFVIAATAIAAYAFIAKPDIQEYIVSMPYATIWASNFFFAFRNMNYFNEIQQMDALLHTWSLGVEEQFYIIWPLAIWLILKNHYKVTPTNALIIITIVGFLACIVWSLSHPITAFYLMPTRIWQFSLGAIIYILRQTKKNNLKTTVWQKKPLKITGYSLIFSCAIFFKDNMVYPGYWALLPSMGTAMIIMAANRPSAEDNTKQTKLTTPLIWLGNRSYSIYLWHWPILVIINMHYSALAVKNIAVIVGLAITLILSAITYRWIELPFWKHQASKIASRTFILGCIALAGGLLAASFHMSRQPLPTHPNQPTDIISSIRNDIPIIYNKGCDTWYTNANPTPCIIGSQSASFTAMLLGDSIGLQWFSAWANIFKAPQWRLIVHTKSACPIVDEDYFYPRIGKIYDVCKTWRNAVLASISQYKPDIIIMGSAGTYDFTATQWVDGTTRILKTLSEASKKVVIIAPTPHLTYDGPSCIFNSTAEKAPLKDNNCATVEIQKNIETATMALAQAAGYFNNVSIFNPTQLVCPNGKCRPLSKDGIPVFRDQQHLTDSFVRQQEPHLKAAAE